MSQKLWRVRVEITLMIAADNQRDAESGAASCYRDAWAEFNGLLVSARAQECTSLEQIPEEMREVIPLDFGDRLTQLRCWRWLEKQR